MFTNITQKFDLLKAVLGGSHPQVPLLVIIFNNVVVFYNDYLVHSNVTDATNLAEIFFIHSNVSPLHIKPILIVYKLRVAS